MFIFKRHKKISLYAFVLLAVLLSSIMFFLENTSGTHEVNAGYEYMNDSIRDAIVFPIDFHSSKYARLAITEASLMHYLNIYMTDDEVRAKAIYIYEALKRGEFEFLEFPAISFILGDDIAYQILSEND